jgi:hypothetical protein
LEHRLLLVIEGLVVVSLASISPYATLYVYEYEKTLAAVAVAVKSN